MSLQQSCVRRQTTGELRPNEDPIGFSSVQWRVSPSLAPKRSPNPESRRRFVPRKAGNPQSGIEKRGHMGNIGLIQLRHVRASNQIAALNETRERVENGVIDRTIACETWAIPLPTYWPNLAPIVANRRATLHTPALWENFEYLIALCKQWIATHPHGANAPRVPLPELWKEVTDVT